MEIKRKIELIVERLNRVKDKPIDLKLAGYLYWLASDLQEVADEVVRQAPGWEKEGKDGENH